MSALRSAARERGGISVIVALCCVALAVVAFGSAAVGRIVAEKKDVQRAADAAVLAAAQIIRQQGLPFNAAKQHAAEAIASNNSPLSINYSWTVNETATAVSFGVKASASVSMPKLIFPSGGVSVEGVAKGAVGQQKYDQANKKLPNMVLVLDVSGSMQTNMINGGGSSINELRQSVDTLFSLPFAPDIKFGAVFFSAGVDAVVPISTSSRQDISNKAHSLPLGPATHTWQALDKARQLLNALPSSDKGRYVLLVSDGQPNDCGSSNDQVCRDKSVAAGNALFNSGVSIFTLHIENQAGAGQVAQLEAFMKAISGKPTSHPNPSYYQRATSGQDLRAMFAGVGASVACPFELPNAVNPALLNVFLRAGANEDVLQDAKKAGATDSSQLNDSQLQFHDRYYYYYETSEKTIYVTEKVCDAIINDHDQLVVRSTTPALTQ